MNWEEETIKIMTCWGWTLDVNDDKRLGFTKYVDEDHEWIRDYDKSTRRFVQMNGRQKINLRVTREEKAVSPEGENG